MRRHWQPYPDHPQVQELSRLLDDVRKRMDAALNAGDFSLARRLLDERRDSQNRLHELTEALLRDDSLLPCWTGHTEADAAAGAVPCLQCGNNIPAGEARCSYCGWTYLTDQTTNAEQGAAADRPRD